jgi:hypothetical protein
MTDVTPLCASHITVSLKGYLSTHEADDSMIYILARSNLGQHSIAHLGSVRLGKYYLVTAILQEGAHTYTAHTQRYMMSIGNQCHHLL